MSWSLHTAVASGLGLYSKQSFLTAQIATQKQNTVRPALHTMSATGL